MDKDRRNADLEEQLIQAKRDSMNLIIYGKSNTSTSLWDFSSIIREIYATFVCSESLISR